MKQIIAISVIVLVASVTGTPSAADTLHAEKTLLFRGDVIRTLDNYRELADLIPVDPATLEQLDWARTRIRQLPVEEFELLAPHIAMSMRHLRQTSELLLDPRFRQGVRSDVQMSVGFPDADYPEISWEFELTGNTDPTQSIPGGSADREEFGICSPEWALGPDAKMVLQNEVLIGEAIHAATSRVCTAITPAGELLCIVPDIIFILLHGLQDYAFMCDSMMYEAEVTATYRRLEHMHEDVEELRTDVLARIAALQVNLTAEADENQVLLEDLGEDLDSHHLNMVARTDSHMDQIRSLSALATEIRDEDLRIMIEISLADPDNRQVGVFRFPEAHGGQLETVRAIVRNSLDLLAANGEGIGNAETFYAQGEAFFARGDWEQAYDRFGKAYRAATGNGGGPAAARAEPAGKAVPELVGKWRVRR